MRYTIITPTINNPTLVRACKSVENQTCTDWEHIVMIDGVNAYVPEHPQRKMFHCPHRHNDVGNTCRYNAWEYAKGDYVYYLDDDNYLAHHDVLEELKQVTAPWALLPIYRVGRGGTTKNFHMTPAGAKETVRHSPSGWGGHRLFHYPPHGGWVDVGSLLIRRDIARWTSKSLVCPDAEMAEQLYQTHPGQDMGHLRPVLIYKFAKGWKT